MVKRFKIREGKIYITVLLLTLENDSCKAELNMHFFLDKEFNMINDAKIG